MKEAIYNSDLAKALNLNDLKKIFADLNFESLFFKRLAPNDNSKNQPYLARHLTDLSFLPVGELVGSTSTSKKRTKHNIKFSAPINFYWLSPKKEVFKAPKAQVIYYPQYPEVRLSGFLKGAAVNISDLMDPYKNGRSEGRVLFLGVRKNDVFAYLASGDSCISNEINSKNLLLQNGMFEQINLNRSILNEVNEQRIRYEPVQSKLYLLKELQRIHKLGWINSKRLNKHGEAIEYTATNGGGYTLEAELGITPNGSQDPDFKGWEVKQYGVAKFDSKASKALTLMTPEPDGGIYKESGVIDFMNQYAYPDKKIENRLNFNGKHIANKVNEKTKLEFVIHGFDSVGQKITDPKGYIGLVDSNGKIAASWSFAKLITHWKNKHNKAVYIPSISRIESNRKQYSYSRIVSLFEGCNINKLLSAFTCSVIYYDPGIKLENIDTDKPKSKRRSQFRVKLNDLNKLYEKNENLDIL